MELTIEQALQKGVAAQKEGKLKEAERLYLSVLDSQPLHPDANHNLGVLAVSVNKVDAALPFFKIALEVKKDAKAHFIFGITLKELGRLEEAEASLKQAIVMKPDYVEAHNNLSITLQELGRLEEAEECYRRTIALKTDFAEAHYNLAITLKELGRLEEAEASLKQAISLKSDFTKAYNNLGSILQDTGRLEEAEVSFRQAISLNPNLSDIQNNLGVTLKKLGRLEEAKESFIKAIALKPDFAEAYSNLGNALEELGRMDEAESNYTKAIELKPDFTSALMNRWQLLFDQKEFEAALKDVDSCNTEKSRACSLETLYELGRIDEIYKRIEAQSESDDQNLRMAAFSSFISEREKKDTAHKFCRNPISFVHFANLSSHLEDPNKFAREVIEELSNKKTIWEPYQKATFKGFQTPIKTNLFANPSAKIKDLKSIIIEELESYYLKFQNNSCSYIQKWPSRKNIWGWQVILKQQGYQKPHIHSGGWLSGVIYLKVVPSLGKYEGAIEFSLNSENYSDLNSPKLTHQPEIGDIVFFPSSLHHRTIPFTTDEDRIIISFDLIPQEFS